jgi:ribosomal protein S18 acetylase RimI-like enzyme
MKPVCIHSKDEIETFLRQHTELHLYEIGDLDDFFWQHTTWYAAKDKDQIRQLILIYTGTSLPVLLALTDDVSEMRALVTSILPFLPRRMHSHLSEEVVNAFANDYAAKSHGKHYKMALKQPAKLAQIDTTSVINLEVSQEKEIKAFYDESYPGNWFDGRMLETGQYFGIQRDGKLVSVAGIHVYSSQYKVAALGNITTHPDFRGLGFGTAVSAELCNSLRRDVDHIGLNVKADNASAISCYKKIGFEIVATYEEFSLDLKK